MSATKTQIKTRADYNVPLELIIVGIVFLIFGLYAAAFHQSSFGFWWSIASVVVIFFGLWNIKTYEIVDGYFKKHHLLGLITTKLPLNTLTSFTIKSVDFSFSNKVFFILALYAKRNNYLTFRIVKLKFSNGRTLRINENLIKGKVLNKLLQEIKRQQKNNSKID